MEMNLIKEEPEELDYEDLPEIVDPKNVPDVSSDLDVTGKDDVDNVKLNSNPSDKKYPQESRCTICMETCRSELFKIHEMLHQKSNYCYICKRTIHKDFHDHVMRMHLGNKCTICEKVFTMKKNLKKHMLLHKTNDPMFQCDHCDKSFRLQESLKVHVQYTHLGIKSFICEVCESAFINSSSLRRHVKKIHSTERKDEIYKCNICFEIFQNIQLKQSHEHAHVAKKECAECGITFASLGGTSRHLRIKHYNTEKCPQCSKILHRSMVNSHIRKEHQKQKLEQKLETRDKFMCSICLKEIASADGLRKHSRQHSTDGPVYSCSQCNATYFWRNSLTAHIKRVHSRSRLKGFACEICETTFTRPQGVKKHMKKMHPDPSIDDEKDGNFHCSICFDQLASFQAKKTHELKHVSSTTCAICSKMFTSVEAIRKHLKSEHYNTEKCSHCTKILHKTMLDAHIWREHRLVECKICHLNFKHHGLLARHRWVHEDIELCTICGCTLNLVNIKRHMKLHLEGKLHRCKICNALVSKIDDHNIKVHRNTEYCYCSQCPEKFENRAARSSHYRRVHSRNIKRSCLLCKLKFKSSDEFKKHWIAKHKLTRRRRTLKSKLLFAFKCDSCGLSFRSEKSLTNHQCLPGQYYCHLCDVRYANKAYVKRHMITYHSPRIIRNEESEEKLEELRLRQICVIRGQKKKYNFQTQ